MNTTTAVDLTAILMELGHTPDEMDTARREVELTIDTFDFWNNPRAVVDGPQRGCITFRDNEPETMVWAPAGHR